MKKNNPHLLKNSSLFALFCLSYLPLLFLLGTKALINLFPSIKNGEFESFINNGNIYEATFLLLLIILSLYAVFGTLMTFKGIKKHKNSSFPVKIIDIKSKNEEALSYLVTYVIPLIALGNDLGVFEYISFLVLFTIYYKLYSTSSLILINPILNMFYGLFEIKYKGAGKTDLEAKSALIICKAQYIEEQDTLNLVRLSHKLYFAY
jgi:hypothetical protein